MVFDKTGTLTVGKPQVQQVVFIHEGMRQLSTSQDSSSKTTTTTSSSKACCANGKPATVQQQQQQGAAQKPCCAKSTKPGRGASPFAADAIQHPEQQQHHQVPGSQQQEATQQGSCADPLVTSVQQLQDTQRAVLAMLAAVESRSEHPLAKAVVSYAEKRGIQPDELQCSIDAFHMQTGRGVRCNLTPAASSNAGSAVPVDVIIGNIPWLQECGVGLSAAARQQRAEMEAEGATVVAAALNGQAVALLAIADSMKPEAPAVLKLLQQRGMQCWMITGDSR